MTLSVDGINLQRFFWSPATTTCRVIYLDFSASSSLRQIENLQEQLRDKDKQLGNLKDRVKSLQTDSSNTDTALATLEEALSEKVCCITLTLGWTWVWTSAAWLTHYPKGYCNESTQSASVPLTRIHFIIRTCLCINLLKLNLWI